MADRYLIETSAVDGYLLEDGTGVLLLEVVLNNYNLPVDPGSFALTGTAIGLRADHRLPVDSGSFTWTGTPVGLLAGRKIGIDSGNFLWTGSDITLTYTPVAGLSPPLLCAAMRAASLLRGGVR